MNLTNQKFHADGSVRNFPGNTIICPIAPCNSSFSEIRVAQQSLKELSLQNKFAFLPEESFHMTVMELLCDQVREKPYWSSLLALSASLEETDAFFQKVLSKTENWPRRISMKFHRMISGDTIKIGLTPFDSNEKIVLKKFRDEISKLTGVCFPGHETYQFHITLAYAIRPLSLEEEEILESWKEKMSQQLEKQLDISTLQKPELIVFHDMFAFRSSRADF